MPTISEILGGRPWPSVPSPIAPADVKANLAGPRTTRPLYAGEYVTHPNGDWSTEITTGTTDENGVTHVIPTLWLVNGTPYILPPALAQQFAKRSGIAFPKFGTIADAEAYTNAREQGEQSMQPSQWRPMFSPIDQEIFSRTQAHGPISRLLSAKPR